MEFVEEVCCNCNLLFKITSQHHDNLIRSKETFYCPSGHSQSYTGEADSEKLKRLNRKIIVEKENCKRILDEEKEGNKRTIEARDREINDLNNKVRAYKGHLTRAKK